LRTDLGGVYFNAIAIVMASGCFLLTGWRVLLIFVAISEVEVLYQFLPFVRMDGYYVVTDLLGLPNLFAFVKPVVASMLGRRHSGQERLDILTRRTRAAIKAWVLLTIPILAIDVCLFAFLAPRLIPGLLRSAELFAVTGSANLGMGRDVGGLGDIIQVVLLVLPAVGFGLMMGMLGSRLVGQLGRHRPVRGVRPSTTPGATVAPAVAPLPVGVSASVRSPSVGLDGSFNGVRTLPTPPRIVKSMLGGPLAGNQPFKEDPDDAQLRALLRTISQWDWRTDSHAPFSHGQDHGQWRELAKKVGEAGALLAQ
jgi:hypothetical protein